MLKAVGRRGDRQSLGVDPAVELDSPDGGYGPLGRARGQAVTRSTLMLATIGEIMDLVGQTCGPDSSGLTPDVSGRPGPTLTRGLDVNWEVLRPTCNRVCRSLFRPKTDHQGADKMTTRPSTPAPTAYEAGCGPRSPFPMMRSNEENAVPPRPGKPSLSGGWQGAYLRRAGLAHDAVSGQQAAPMEVARGPTSDLFSWEAPAAIQEELPGER